MTGSDEPANKAKAKAARIVHHLFRFFKTVGEVFVVINGHGTSVCLKNLDALLEKFMPRIKHLVFVIVWVVAVLRDEENCVHIEFIAAAPERLGDSRVNGKTKFSRAVNTLVALRLLVNVERHDFHIRAMPSPLGRIANEKPVGEVLCVR